MATFNTYSVVKRYNRPSILLRTLLEQFFTNNGTYFNPQEVSSVCILPDTGRTLGSPAIYIDYSQSALGTPAYGKLNASGVAATVAKFDVSNSNTGTVSPPSSYSGTATPGASAIYSAGTGHYAVVADGIAFPSYSSLGISDGKWFDVWLVKDFATVDASAGWKLYWNKFETFNDRIITFTEPYQITSHSKLQNKYIQLSSIPTLRITTEQFVANKNMSQDLKTIWRDGSIDNAEIRIRKRNPETTGTISNIKPADGSFTSSGVDVSSEDTILYTWNTTGEAKGDYIVQVKYTLLEQTFVSDEFSLVLQ